MKFSRDKYKVLYLGQITRNTTVLTADEEVRLLSTMCENA
jgi:hypothetical protein